MRKVTLILSLLFFVVSMVSAAPNKWSDKSYNYTVIQTVLIMPPTVAEDVADKFAVQKTQDMVSEELKKVIMTPMLLESLLPLMGTDLGVDLVDLLKKEPDKCMSIVNENASKYVDAIMYINVPEFGWTKKYVPPSTYTYTKKEKTYITSSNGTKTTIESPKQKTGYIAGGERETAVASLEVNLYDAKTNKIIWGYSDEKKEQKGLLNNANPEKFMRKIIEKAFEDIPLPKVPEKQKGDHN